ncbi:MAG TPA: hypothetical protein VFE62_04595, partial [Gemmataceae bacterium]|nr:hypothetical protein [Gemmataceae bacterium]
MLRCGISLFVLLGAITCLAPSSAQPAKESVEELEKKLKALREQIEELRKKEQDLADQEKRLIEEKRRKEAQARIEAERKEAERRRKEEAQRKAKAAAELKKHYAKIEIRGLLSSGAESVNAFTHPPTMAWTVTINELKWQLNFGDNKNLETRAKALAGKP